jgi:DNA mismatch endonuclease (patch repair protein)
VIFVNGCFWHQHPGCRAARIPGTNVEFWVNKLEANVRRDRRVRAALRRDGWRVFVVWECQVHSVPRLESLIRRLTADSQ